MRLTKFIAILLLVTGFGLSSSLAQNFSESYKFLKAVKELKYQDIKMAIEKGVNINTRDYDDQTTALIKAVRMKEAPLAKYLLGNGAKPDLVGKDGKTALVIAAEFGDRALVAILLEFKADIDLADNNGTTPLIAAVYANNRRVAKLLLKAGADFTLEDYSGRTALQHAIDDKRRRLEIILKDAGATQ